MNQAASSLSMQSVASQSSPDSRELRALFLLNSLNVGGSETKTVRIVNGLWRRGIRTGIAYLNEPAKLLDALDPQIPTWNLARRGKFSAAAVRRLRELLAKLAPAYLVSVNMYPALYSSLATLGMQSRPRTIALLNTTLLAGADQWRRTFYRPFLRRMDGIVFGCELQRDQWQPFIRAGANSCGVIYNGVDTQQFAPVAAVERAGRRGQLGLPADAFVIGSVGRLAVEKNQRALIVALAALRKRGIDAHLLLVGEGNQRTALERQVHELRLQPHVTLAGSQRDVRPWLAAMDVFVLPSTHIETFSNAALEAMAMAKPVILSEVGGATEMVRDGIDGYTLASNTFDSTLLPVLSRLHDDAQLRVKLGRAARERAQAKFSAVSMIDEFAELIADPRHVQMAH